MMWNLGSVGISSNLHRWYITLYCLVSSRREDNVLMRSLWMRSNIVLRQALRLLLFLAISRVMLRLFISFERGELTWVLLLVNDGLSSEVDDSCVGGLTVVRVWRILADRWHYLIALLSRARVVPRCELFFAKGAWGEKSWRFLKVSNLTSLQMMLLLPLIRASLFPLMMAGSSVSSCRVIFRYRIHWLAMMFGHLQAWWSLLVLLLLLLLLL